MISFADEFDEPEVSEMLEVSEHTSTVQDEQTEADTVEPIAPEPEAEDILDAQIEDAADETAINDDQQVPRTTTTIETVINSDYEYETLVTLKSIEYQLKIISGGVILTVIGFYIWLTVYLPIKKFMFV